MPPIFYARSIGKGRHRCAINPRGKRAKDILDVVGILPTASEIPAFVPVCRLNRKTPVIFEVKGIPITSPFEPMTFNTLHLHHKLGATFDGFRSIWNCFQLIEFQNKKIFELGVLPLPIFNQLRCYKGQHVFSLLLCENTFPGWHGRTWEPMRDRLK